LGNRLDRKQCAGLQAHSREQGERDELVTGNEIPRTIAHRYDIEARMERSRGRTNKEYIDLTTQKSKGNENQISEKCPNAARY
jgi:diketogulonate reductase-like aldo/keto reductase